MNRLSTALFSALVSMYSFNAVAEEFRDTDWNVGFYDNCQLPCTATTDPVVRPRSIQWQENAGDRQLAFTLLPGDVGGCSADTDPRNGAPFWERAEIIQYQTLQPDTRHLISFQAIFKKGFAGKRETFFQIHGWSKSCPSAPLLMLQFDSHRLNVQVLTVPENGTDPETSARLRGHLEQALTMRPEIETLRNRTNTFEVTFDRTVQPNLLSILINGQTLLESKPVHVMSCAEPRVKMGIYRPGRINPGSSILLLDKVNIKGPDEGMCTENNLGIKEIMLPGG